MKGKIFREKIFKMIESAGELKPGVAHIEVKHDDDCPAIKTQRLKEYKRGESIEYYR